MCTKFAHVFMIQYLSICNYMKDTSHLLLYSASWILLQILITLHYCRSCSCTHGNASHALTREMLLQHPLPYTMHKTVFKELPDSDIYVDGMTPHSVKLHIESRLFRKKHWSLYKHLLSLKNTHIWGIWPLAIIN